MDTYIRKILDDAGFQAANAADAGVDFVMMEMKPPGNAVLRWVGELKRKVSKLKATKGHCVVYMPKGSGKRFVQTLHAVELKSPDLFAHCSFVRSPEDAVSALLARNYFSRALDQSAREDAVVETPDWLGAHPGAPSIRDKGGRLDARLLTKIFPAVTQAQLAALAGVSRQAISDTPTSPKAAPVMEKFERLTPLRTIPQLADDENFNAWWHRKLAPLEGRSPAEVVKAGDLDELVALAERIVTGDTAG